MMLAKCVNSSVNSKLIKEGAVNPYNIRLYNDFNYIKTMK